LFCARDVHPVSLIFQEFFYAQNFQDQQLKSLAASASEPVVVSAADTTPVASPSTKGPSVNERLDSARKAIEAKDWSKALSDLNQAAREEPRNADVQNLLGYSYRKRATPDLARSFEHYNIALKLDPNHKGAHEYIGEAYLMDKKPAEAEKHLAQLEVICGNKTCEEYDLLAKSIASYKSKTANGQADAGGPKY
jgi:Flp pilus assembly protein TadD